MTPSPRPVALLLALGLLLLAPALQAQTLDPARGERLYRQVLAPGLLACMDCHGDDPERQNFGNIAAARNSPTAIERAVAANTGGMRVFGSVLQPRDYADLAAFLGVPVQRLAFESTLQGEVSAPQAVRVLGSSKRRTEDLRWQVDGEDFRVSGGDCGAQLEALQNCTLLLTMQPQASGELQGVLRLRHADSRGDIAVALRGRSPPAPPASVRLQPALLEHDRHGGVRRMELLNDSLSPLRLQSVALSGEGFSIWGGNCTDGLWLRGGERCWLDLLRWPGRPAEEARLQWRHNGQGGESVGLLRAQASAAAVLTVPPAAPPAAGLLRLLPLQPLRTPVGAERDLQVWWVNRSEAALAPPALRWTGDAALSLRENRCPGVTLLAPGQACAMRLRHAPLQAGVQRGVLAADGLAELPVQAEARDAGVQLDQSELAVPAGAPATLTVQGVGPAPVTLAPWRLQGPGRAAWQLSSDCPAQLGEGAVCHLQVRAVAAADGPVQLVGQAGSDAIELPLRPAGADDAPTPPPPSPAGSPLVVEAADPDALRWTLRNDGATELSLLGARWAGRDAGAFAINAQRSSCGSTLAAGAHCTLQGVLLAQRSGAHEAHWLHPQRVLGLRAQAHGAPGALPAWRGEALAFEVRSGAAAAKSQWLVNRGTQSWWVGSWLVGEGYAMTEGGDCPQPPFVLGAGAACRLELAWQRGAAGALLVAQSVSGETLSVPMSVSESAAERPNAGHGGGSAGRLDLLLVLPLAAALVRARPGRAATMKP